MTTPATATTDRAAAFRGIQTVFATLWAGAHLFHALEKGGTRAIDVFTNAWLLFVVVAAVWLLRRPSSSHRLALLAGTQLAAFTVHLPYVANHWLLMALANVVLLGTYLGGSDADGWQPGALLARSRRLLWTVFLLTYGAAAIAKLNTTFLDVADSCAVWLWNLAVTPLALPEAGPTLAAAVIAGTLGIELLVPVLLLVGRTRTGGIRLAAVFHIALALPPSVAVPDFTLVVLAFLATFLHPAGATAAVGRWGRLLDRLPRGAARRGGPASAAAAVTLLVGRDDVVPVLPWPSVVWAVYVLIAGVALTVLLTGTRTTSPAGADDADAEGSGPPPVRDGRAPRLLAVGVVAVTVLNAAQPYLGGKTMSSFTMFSNLATEQGRSNHLLLPRQTWTSTWQDDLVTIEASDDPALAEFADSGDRLVFLDLQQRVRRTPGPFALTYVRDGQRVDLDDATAPGAVPQAHPVADKLLLFRPVSPPGQRPRCRA